MILLTSCSQLNLFQKDTNSCQRKPFRKTKIYHQLKDIPNIVKIKPAETDSGFKDVWELHFKQPIDHNNPAMGHFTQQVFLGHKDYSKPVVYVTAGYSVSKFKAGELADILDANQIIVEHRYFEDSKPDSMVWKYMNTRQAAADHHKILTALKNIYQDKWVNTGISKGGQTTLLFKSYYPEDVDATVAYVAPLNHSQEDPRIIKFFNQVGTAKERKKLRQYQILALQNKDAILPRFKWYCKGKNYQFSYGNYMKAFEYSILEFPFIYWQWSGLELDSINLNTDNPDSLLEPLTKSSATHWYTDKSLKGPSMYQFATQLGYYGELDDGLPFDTLFSSCDYSYPFFAGDTSLKFNPKPMQRLDSWLKENGDYIIYIYGREDPWGATGVEPSDKVNAIKKVLKDGDHSTRIKDLQEEDRKEVISTLKKWLELE
ncbi:MAG: peptidase [Candidatus Marinimicrobia bacterium]|nr:peptidase [Candidatus Neomarinimicrobiota bacterium]